MILIKDIKYYETERDIVELVHRDAPVFVGSEEGGTVVNAEVLSEFVCGQKFVTNGVEVVIGMSKEVRELLGMPLEAYANMQSAVSTAELACWAAQQELEEYIDVNLWTRIKRVFKL